MQRVTTFLPELFESGGIYACFLFAQLDAFSLQKGIKKA